MAGARRAALAAALLWCAAAGCAAPPCHTVPLQRPHRNSSSRRHHGHGADNVDWLPVDELWWHFETQKGLQMMATADDQLAYVASSDEMSQSQLYALRLSDGAEVWNTGTGAASIRAPVKVNPTTVLGSGLLISVAGSPCVARVYNSENGNAVWDWNDQRSASAQLSGAAVASYADGMHLMFLVSGLNFTLFALEIGNTKPRWQASVAMSDDDPYSAWNPPLDPVYDVESNLVVAYGNGVMAVYDALSGELAWRVKNTVVSSTPTIVDGVLLTSVSYPDGRYQEDSALVAFNLTTGDKLWSIWTVNPPTGCAKFKDGTDRLVYAVSSNHPMVGSNPGGVHVLNGVQREWGGMYDDADASGGALVNDTSGVPPGLDYLGTRPTADDCRMGCRHFHANVSAFIHSKDSGDCFCRLDGVVELDDATGWTSGVWRTPSESWTLTPQDGATWSSPVAGNDGAVFFTITNDTEQALVALKEGKLLWSHAVKICALFLPPSSPAVSDDGRFVVFASQNGTVFNYLVEMLPPTPEPPSGSSAWYQETIYQVFLILAIALTIIAVVSICVCSRRRHNIDSPARKFDIVSKLGSGSYGVVYLVRRRTDKMLCALKYLSCDDEEQQERALLEFKTMRNFQGHPNMIRVMETFMNWKSESEERAPLIPPTNSADAPEGVRADDIQKFSRPRYVCLVMPFYRKGDLKNFALSSPDYLPEALLLDYTAQMCSLLQYLHDRSHALVHRDLKPENVLISDDTKSCVVSDFGLAKKLFTQYCATRAGTLCYMAPECWAHHYGREADIWAIGCILYSVATKRMEEHNIRVMFSEALQTDNFQEVVADELMAFGYPILSCLVANLLEPDYHFRPSAGDVLDWLGVPRFDPTFPQMPQRKPEDEIRIPPLIIKPMPRKKSRKTGSDRTSSAGSTPNGSQSHHNHGGGHIIDVPHDAAPRR